MVRRHAEKDDSEDQRWSHNVLMGTTVRALRGAVVRDWQAALQFNLHLKPPIFTPYFFAKFDDGA